MIDYHSLGFEIAKVHYAIRAQFQELLKPYGITVQQFEVMRILSKKSGITAAQLVDLMISDSSTIMFLLNQLESKMLIIRKKDKSDRRIKLIYPTREGSDLTEKLIDLTDHYNKLVFECCSDKELKNFKFVLEKLYSFSKSHKVNRHPQKD